MEMQSPVVATRRRSLRLVNSATSAVTSPTSNGYSPHHSRRSRPITDNNLSQLVPSANMPLTPIQNSLVFNLRQRLEQQLSEKADKKVSMLKDSDETSPGLATLRTTPGPKLRDKQKMLLRKHEEARSRAGKLTVGGGVSIWPGMENMRLTTNDFVMLAALATGLFGTVIILHQSLHGSLVHSLHYYLRGHQRFAADHTLDKVHNQEQFNESVLHWHTSFLALMGEMTSKLTVSFSKTSASYQLYIVIYITGIAILLYYIADNVLATNNLTPRRIKVWICLLIVMATWTVLMMRLLVLAQTLELAVETNVHMLSAELSDLVYLNFDLTTYRDVVSYWQTRCLPPQTHGTLTILGMVAVRDVSYYLQYYSLPVLTALLAPVVKLIVTLRQVYMVKPHP